MIRPEADRGAETRTAADSEQSAGKFERKIGAKTAPQLVRADHGYKLPAV
jgi:hypothetical protein